MNISEGENSQDNNHVIPKGEKSNIKAMTDQDLLMAAALVKDATASRNMHFKTDEKSIRAYMRYSHVGFEVVLYICIWANLLLAILEKPSVKGVSLPYWGTMMMEAIFIGYFFFRLFQNAQFQEAEIFWRDPKNLCVLITLLLTLIDVVCYTCWVNTAPAAMAARAVRWSRPLRPLLLINFPEGRQLRKAFRNIRRTLPDILHVLILFIASIALFALLAVKLFQKRGLTYPNGEAYFTNYWESFWNLYVLVTTANNPDVMMPAYDNSNWFAIFFVVYIILNLYIFMNIVLAVIYNNYKRHLKNEVKAMVYLKRRLLSRAFDLLKAVQSDRYVVTKEVWHKLMSIATPKRSTVQLDLLLQVLDDRGTNSIEKKDFLKVADLLNVELSEVKADDNMFEKCCPKWYISSTSEKLKVVVRTRYFQWAFDLVILVNAVCIGLNLEDAEWFFLAVFTIEIILKLYAYAPKKYFTTFWNLFDFFVIAAAWIVTIIGSATNHGDIRANILDFLMVLRILRLIRLAGSIDRFKIVLTTIVNIGPSIATYGGVIFVIYYVFAIIGMEVFNGMIDYHGYTNLNATTLFCGNPRLNGSEFVIKRYCSNNFNSLTSAFVLLFELMVVNQWHVLSDGYMLVTNKAARLYFITFHLFCVVILLNILTAFVLEVFILEYTLSKGHLESVIETKIKEMGLGLGQNPKHKLKKKLDRQELVENMEECDGPGSDAADGTDSRPCPGGVMAHPGGVASPASATDEGAAVQAADVELQAEGAMPCHDVPGLRFKLKNKGSKGVEVLLQLMFEGEIEPTDEGTAEYGPDLEDLQPAQDTSDNVTFSSVI